MVGGGIKMKYKIRVYFHEFTSISLPDYITFIGEPERNMEDTAAYYFQHGVLQEYDGIEGTGLRRAVVAVKWERIDDEVEKILVENLIQKEKNGNE